MKDEEMAEEYLQGIEGDDCVIITDREERKQAFLAGLKAGRPQWHNLRKNPTDLPKEQKEYWCKINYYESDEVFNGCLTYNPKLKGFNLDPDEELFEVTAWCEIPTFDKE